MPELYVDKIKTQIGRITGTAVADNYFPFPGQNVRIDAALKWAQATEWHTQDGSGKTVVSAGDLTLQRDSKVIPIVAAGELKQALTASNYLDSLSVVKTIYAMVRQSLPYFSVTTEKEVVRAGDTGYIDISGEHGYHIESSRIVARLYRENETGIPVKTLEFPVKQTPDGSRHGRFLFDLCADRGIYDVEVDVTDTTSGITFSKRIDKLVTVVPALCPQPADTSTGYEVSSTYDSMTTYTGKKTFEIRLWRDVGGSGLNYAEAVVPKGDRISSYERMKVGLLPAGTTLCLKIDPQEPEPYMCRFLPTGTVEANVSSENGSANFTYENPLVVTHDNPEVWNFVWQYYGAVNMGNNLRNIVLDGYGYNNTGIKFIPQSGTAYNTCFFLSSGTSDFEMFGIDIDGSGFAGIAAKTDPDANNPWFWRESGWEFKNLRIHHCTIQNTYGEGVYIGYYGTGAMSGTNTAGEKVTYHAHPLRDLRLYRTKFYHTGLDPVQINNAVGVELYELDIEKCSHKKEVNQSNTFSCTMDGRVYNCRVWDNYSIIGLIFPFLSSLEIFNCILTADKDSTVFSWTKWSESGKGDEFYDPDETLQNDTHVYKIYNNIIKGRTIATVNGNIAFSKFTMNDNVFITSSGDSSLPIFFSGEGNLFIQNNGAYDILDSYLKVADTANYNYQPNFNSLLVSAGKSGMCAYDMRGYKRWYNNVRHCGPLMGVYKDLSVPDTLVMLTGISLSDLGNKVVSVTFNYTDAMSPVKYRVGETADLSAMEWADYSDSIIYTFASIGSKTLYGQLQDADGDASEVRSVTFTVTESVGKAVISFGWNRNSLTGQVAQQFDDANKLTRVAYYYGEPIFYWEDGTQAGTLSKQDAFSASTSIMQESSKGAVTGDGGGFYPDDILKNNVVVSSNSTAVRSCLIKVSPGTYRIRIYCSTVYDRESVTFMSIQLVTGDGDGAIVHDVAIPEGYTPKNNLTEWLEAQVEVPASGVTLNWGIKDSGGAYYVCPLNIVEMTRL